MNESMMEKYAGVHTEEAQKAVGAWRWLGLYENRDFLLPYLEYGKVLDIGGAAGPVGYGDICDIESHDINGNQVKYNSDDEITEKYDTVFSSHVLEHFDYPLTHLSRWRDLTKDGGFVILHLPSIYNYNNYPGINKNHKWIFTTTGDIRQGVNSRILPVDYLLEMTGYKIRFLEYVDNCSILAVGENARKNR